MSTKNELTRERLIEACHTYGLDCFTVSPSIIDGLLSYLSLLMKWNRVMNLVGKTQWQDALRLLLADSAHVFAFIVALQEQGTVPDQPLVWDLGAGAGLPGIPLRLVWQNGQYILVDAREKRTLFLKTVLSSHDYGATQVIQARVEQFMPTQEPAHMVISRAFMPWQEVLDLIEPYVQDQGIAIFLTLLPAPEQHISPATGRRWLMSSEAVYTIDKDQRHLWAMRLE